MLSSTILQKLEAVKNLADNAGTREEAEAASAALTKLLTKHNLTMSEFVLRSSQVQARKPAEGYVKDYFELPARGTWRGDLLTTLCKYHFCSPLFYSDGKRTVIVGEPKNVEVVKRLFGYLSKDIDGLANRAWTVHQVFGSKLPGKTFKTSFKLGCVVGLDRAMREAREEALTEIPDGSALMVIKDQELSDAVKVFFPELTKGKAKTSNVDFEAYLAGSSAGARLSDGERFS